MGISIFVVGLFKKVVIADSLAIYADAGYSMLRAGHPLDSASAWVTVLCYSFQLYYDFSGYSGCRSGSGGNSVGVVSVLNLESSGVGAPERRPRHDKRYHEV